MYVAGALHRNTIDEIFNPLLTLVKNLVLRSAKPSRREAVDSDAVRPPVICKAHGELTYTAAACAIRRESCISKDAGNRPNVDDAAIAMLDHAARDSLRNKKGTAQIGV